MNVEKGRLCACKLKAYADAYQKDEKNQIIRHAMSRTSVMNLAYDPSSFKDVDFHFSDVVKTMAVANQKSSGRCWIFAGLNILREIIAKKKKIKKFELSQNYISLFDKIEKSNWILEAFIDLADKPHDDRLLDYILTSPLNDGGQWDMFVSLVKKYGIVPQSAFPETYQSNNTRELDQIVSSWLRQFAYDAHCLHEEGKDEEIRPLKEKVMGRIYQTFFNAFGVPPEKFDFEYTDEKDEYHVERDLTPQAFFETHIGKKIDEYQSLIHYPESDRPYNRNYTVEYLGNVVGGKPINHVNVKMERLKELVVAMIKDGEPVWFGSDVGYFRDRSSYAWATGAIDYESLLGADIKFDKGAMLYYRASAMGHAMVITGVNLGVDGKPNRYKIENSWGEDNGLKGYYVIGEDFFDRFVYQAVVLKKYLNKEELAASNEKPIVLPLWDPMGTLA